ncbi:MAG TPA: hypothetical protein VLK84_22230 [Longimicrobium sp.]|nr:hypothetical protein [Longimicrobium sp.]
MRFGVLALAGLLVLPAVAHAQNDETFAAQPPADLVPFSRFAITPWVGVRVGYGSGDYYAITENGDQFLVDEDRGGASAVGLNAEYQLTGPLNLVAGAAYSGADEDDLNLTTVTGGTSTTTSFVANGPQMWFFKAGLQYRLPDPIPDNRRFHPAAYVTVAPSMVLMDHPDIEGLDNDDVTGSSRHFGLNLGVDAVTNIGSRGLALSLGFEDYLTFWNQDRLRLRDEVLVGGIVEEPVVIDYDASTANILMLRLGLSWRF